MDLAPVNLCFKEMQLGITAHERRYRIGLLRQILKDLVSQIEYEQSPINDNDSIEGDIAA